MATVVRWSSEEGLYTRNLDTPYLCPKFWSSDQHICFLKSTKAGRWKVRCSECNHEVEVDSAAPYGPPNKTSHIVIENEIVSGRKILVNRIKEASIGISSLIRFLKAGY